MSKACSVCGGLIFASNEVAGYSGPICNGMHVQPNMTVSYDHTIHEKLDRIIRLLETSAKLKDKE